MKNQNVTFAERARRTNEIAQYGRLLSLRPSVVHNTKKNYSRKDKSWKNSSFNLDFSE